MFLIYRIALQPNYNFLYNFSVTASTAYMFNKKKRVTWYKYTRTVPCYQFNQLSHCDRTSCNNNQNSGFCSYIRTKIKIHLPECTIAAPSPSHHTFPQINAFGLLINQANAHDSRINLHKQTTTTSNDNNENGLQYNNLTIIHTAQHTVLNTHMALIQINASFMSSSN